MEKFPNNTEIKLRNEDRDIFERITNHSREFDKQISETRACSPEEVREAWQVKEWRIGDTTIKAIGVLHIPETFLEFRQEIEKAIQESDVVVNEFAPEALGFYDKTAAPRLQSIKSRFNENYNLEQLRQEYLKKERYFNIGLFHHEIELLAVKYDKNMALADLIWSKNVEEQLQDSYLYAYEAEQTSKIIAKLKKAGIYAGATFMGVMSLGNFLENFFRKSEPKMSRRNFLKLGLMASASTALASIGPKMISTPPQTTLKNEKEGIVQSGYDYELAMLRDPILADSLQQLAKLDYKKIAFIYGTAHLKIVEEYLNNLEMASKQITANKDVIERNNSNVFRIYQLSPGNNTSEKFVASKEKVWKLKNN